MAVGAGGHTCLLAELAHEMHIGAISAELSDLSDGMISRREEILCVFGTGGDDILHGRDTENHLISMLERGAAHVKALGEDIDSPLTGGVGGKR